MSVPPDALSDAKIRTLRPKDKPYEIADFDGLFRLVKPSVTKSWRFNCRFAGKGKLMAFGDYPSQPSRSPGRRVPQHVFKPHYLTYDPQPFAPRARHICQETRLWTK